MNQLTTWIGAGAAVFLLVFFFWNAPAPEVDSAEDRYEPRRMTLSGVYLCLPPADTSGPQTLECALGLRTDEGSYYALDFAAMSQIPPPIPMGSRITAAGVFVPIERLSTDHWRKYSVKGIFSVTDSVEVVEQVPRKER